MRSERSEGRAVNGADRIAAVEPAGRLAFDDFEDTGRQVAERVEPESVRDGGAEQGARCVPQLDGGAGNRGFDALENAVVIAVVIDESRQHRGQVFAEIVIQSVTTRRQPDRTDLVVSIGRSAERSDVIVAIQHVGGRGLDDRVFARRQIGELVAPVGAGLRGSDQLALRVEELDFDIGERHGQWSIAVAIGIGLRDAAGKPPRRDFAEQIFTGRVAAVQRDLDDPVARVFRATPGIAVNIAGAIQAVEVAGRLLLFDAIRSGYKVGEAVMAIGVGDGVDGRLGIDGRDGNRA